MSARPRSRGRSSGPLRRSWRTVAALAVLTVGSGLLAGCADGGNEVTIDIRRPDASASDTSPTADASGSSGASAPAAPASSVPFTADGEPNAIGAVATGLTSPWGIAFLPDGRALVTERDTARVLLLSPREGGFVRAGASGRARAVKARVTEVGRLRIARPRGEGGLLGVAVSPTYDQDRLVYFYVSTQRDNRVVRARLSGGRLSATTPVLTGIPVNSTHNGGRLLFGPGGYLFVSTGDAQRREEAQQRDSLAGKILRITPDGAPAPGNPFGSPVWSLGHRNVQGLALDADGSLWASEFGDKTSDELNRILPGNDYGWPEAEGRQGSSDPALTPPMLTWPTEDASPSGLAATDGYLWMAALRGERLWRIPTRSGQVEEPTAYLTGRYGRLRSVVRAPDGRLWLATSNTDGRGEPRRGDDRILVLEP